MSSKDYEEPKYDFQASQRRALKFAELLDFLSMLISALRCPLAAAGWSPLSSFGAVHFSRSQPSGVGYVVTVHIGTTLENKQG